MSAKDTTPVATPSWQKKAAGTTAAGAILPTPPAVQTEPPKADAPEAPVAPTSDDHNQVLANAATAAKAPEAAIADAIEGEVMVTATVPKAFQLRLDNHVVNAYKAGVQEMPLVHAEHWYSKANGVQVYSPK